MIRLADFVVKFLEKKKIDTIFTVSGGGSIFLCDALYNSKKIKYISHHQCSYRRKLSLDRLDPSNLYFRTSFFESNNTKNKKKANRCSGN